MITAKHTKEIKKKLKELAKTFSLNYAPNWFSYLAVSKREQVLNDFITGCPIPDYNKYGKTCEQRIKNIDQFLNSEEYVNHLHICGQAKCKEKLKREIELANLIKNEKVKQECLSIFRKASKLRNKEYALVVRSDTKEELAPALDILLHEWIHILLSKNKMQRSYYDTSDEGLTMYLGLTAIDKEKNIPAFIEEIPQGHEEHKQYCAWACEWHEKLKHAKTPSERKKIIIAHYANSAKIKKREIRRSKLDGHR